VKLTKSYIDKLTYSKRNHVHDIHWDESLPGFGLRVYPSGKKVFVIHYRVKGRKHYKLVARYGTMTLEQAREAAKREFVVIMDNKDPLEARRKSQATIPFKELCEIYIERYAKQHKKTWFEDLRRNEKYLLPAFRAVRIDAITRADCGTLHGSLGLKYPYGANRCLEQLSKMFELAREWGYLPENHSNPARGIKAFREKQRDRWVRPDEMPKLAEAINNEKNFYGRQAIWLYLLLGVRRTELLTAKWTDIDWDREELRLEETKNGKVHYVPLSRPAIAILRSLPVMDGNPYILPGAKSGQHLVGIQNIWERIRAEAGVEDVRLHDLRRTLGSWLAQAGNSLHLIGRVLNHSSQSTTAIYARFAQDNVREALENHGEKLMSIARVQSPQTDLPQNELSSA